MTSCGHSKQEHDSVLICLTCAAARDKAARELRDAAEAWLNDGEVYCQEAACGCETSRMRNAIHAFDRAYSGGGE